MDTVVEEPAANAKEAKEEPESTLTEEGVMPKQPATVKPMADCSPAGEHTEVPVMECSALGHELPPSLQEDDLVEVHAPEGEIDEWWCQTCRGVET